MNHSMASALVTHQGERVLLRIAGQHYDLSFHELRGLLDLPEGSPGLGITIDGERFCFEFTDDHVVELSAKQLQRRLAESTLSNA